MRWIRGAFDKCRVEERWYGTTNDLHVLMEIANMHLMKTVRAAQGVGARLLILLGKMKQSEEIFPKVAKVKSDDGKTNSKMTRSTLRDRRSSKPLMTPAMPSDANQPKHHFPTARTNQERRQARERTHLGPPPWNLEKNGRHQRNDKAS